jgi:dihydropyrimidinase
MSLCESCLLSRSGGAACGTEKKAMSEYDLVIRNGTVATAADTMACDVGIKDGVVATLGRGLASGAREIDARGLLVLPGGIDSHCHIEQRSSAGVVCADDFYSATVAAAFGGTTTVIPFAAQHKGQSLRRVVEEYHQAAAPKAVIDYAFHLIISDPTADVLGQELPALVRDGYTSFKVYMTYDLLKLDDRQLLDILAVARREGALVMVHAENHDMIKWLAERLIARGLAAPRYHATSHARLAEGEATNRAVALSQLLDVPILIVHVSAAEAISVIRAAQTTGLKIYGETCPQYLFLTAEDLGRPGLEGAKFCCSPPPRDHAAQQAVWTGLGNGTFQVFSSDHAPYRFDATGKLPKGERTSFREIANGVPGIELRLPLLFSEGVGGGRLDLNAFVALGATNHAKLYGLYPKKGTIAVGSDADIAIWDPQRQVTVTAAMLHDNTGYTPYEGRRLKGWPVTVLSRGRVVVADGKLMAGRGSGAFLPCALSQAARPLGRPAPELAFAAGAGLV